MCEQNQPWIAGSDERTDVSVTGVRATFSFPNLSPSVIQTDNVLGAGIAVYVPSLNPDASAPGVDFAYYGFVNVNSSGTISFVSSGWITCEWNSCPSHYTSVQSCYQYQGTYFWGTCTGHTLNDRHWQLFVDQFKCNNCSISDKYLVQMAWVQNSYAQWNYYKNGVLWHSFSYTPPTDWQVGTYFKTGTGQTCPITCYPKWRHFQFGVTSMYDIGQGSGWEVDVDDPLWTNTADLSSWYPFSTVKTLQGIQAFYDNDYAIGSATYLGIDVSGSTSGCDQHAIFKDTGASVGSGLTLWENAGVGCSFQPPTAPNFTISPHTSSLCVFPGTLNGAYVTMQSVNGLSGNIVMTKSLQPYNSRVWSFFSYPTSDDNTITVSISSGGIAYAGFQVGAENNSFAEGSYTLTVIGTDGSLVHSATLQVTVSYSSCPPP